MLKVAGNEANDTCGNAQLSAGLEAGIEGAVHTARSLWEDAAEMDEWIFLLVNALNAFNTDNHIATLWITRHQWRSGAQFSHNCYHIQAILLIQVKDSYEA